MTDEEIARTGTGLVCTYCGARGHLNAPCPDIDPEAEGGQ